jgi:hypothetical protein
MGAMLAMFPVKAMLRYSCPILPNEIDHKALLYSADLLS